MEHGHAGKAETEAARGRIRGWTVVEKDAKNSLPCPRAQGWSSAYGNQNAFLTVKTLTLLMTQWWLPRPLCTCIMRLHLMPLVA